jgi:FtsP/CotA-like multicopper oxidase with cupredoxin domain
VGAIQINGPAAANYDIDLGTYTISDWYYEGAGTIEARADTNLQRGGPPPFANTILINGTNKNPAGGGQYSNVKLTPGKKHRLRLINTAVDNSVRS